MVLHDRVGHPVGVLRHSTLQLSVAAGDAAAAAVRPLQLRESARIRGGVPQLLRLQGLGLQPAVQLPRVLLVRQQLLPRVAVGAATIGITVAAAVGLDVHADAAGVKVQECAEGRGRMQRVVQVQVGRRSRLPLAQEQEVQRR